MIRLFSKSFLENWCKTIITAVFVITAAIVFLVSIHPFLAINKPVQSDILIVEGWLPDSFLKLAVTEFNNGNYKKLITLGGAVQNDSAQSEYFTWAEQAANKISHFGLDNKLLYAVPYFEKTNQRTFTSFLALRNWLSNSDLNVSALNVFTAGVHGRKSYIICKKLMGENIKIGVISAPPVRYNPKYWWLSKRGGRLVMKNTIGYIYALFVTSPQSNFNFNSLIISSIHLINT
jgi:hypothetical protein